MLVHDLTFAVRMLLRQPLFAATAVVTLALGIGATTAIFSVVDGVVLKALPYQNADRLYFLRTAMTDGRATAGTVSPVELLAIAERSQTVEAASGAFQLEGALENPAGDPIPVVYHAVPPRFFDVGGLPMTHGRGFTPDEDAVGGPNLAVLSHATWRDAFGADPGIVGRPVRLDRESATVVGVAHPDFQFPKDADLWVNARVAPTVTGHFYDAWLRVRDGRSLAEARSELTLIAQQLMEQYPAANRNRTFSLQGLQEYIVGDTRATLTVLLGGALTLLLIACVNVTNLMLSRGEVRAKEIAIRVAVGAGRGRVLRQLLTESVVLAATGALAGLLVAFVGLRVLVGLAPNLPRLDAVALDGRTLLFALVLTIVVGVIVGFAPALRLLTTDLRSLVNEGGRGGSAGPWRQRLLGGLVVAEVALAVVVVIGAALLVRSFDRLSTADPGFRPDAMATFEIRLPVAEYATYDRVADAHLTLLDRIRQQAGVQAVSMASTLPLSGQPGFMSNITVEGDAPMTEPPRARIRSAGAGYFAAMGVSVAAGREFTDRDRRDSPAVAVVNETFVRTLFAGRDPIGQRIGFSTSPLNTDPANPVAWQRPKQAEIVGVVADMKYASLAETVEPSVYQPQEQFTYRKLSVVVRAAGDATAAVSAIRREVASFDPALPITVRLMPDVVQGSLARQRLAMLLMLSFGTVALVLAAVGIYGVMAYGVAQRRRELAIRAALGASSHSIGRLILWTGVALALSGIALGLAGAFGLQRVIASQLYEISAADAVSFVVVPLLLAAVGVLASLVPAWTASRIDPALMLRSE